MSNIDGEEAQFGFSPETAPCLTPAIAREALSGIERLLSVYTSTPEGNDLRGIMDLSFSQCYEQASAAHLQGMDNDSGYVSHHQESNLEPSQESLLEPIVTNTVYLSEDALLEEPKSFYNSEDTKAVYEEFTSMYYLNSIVETSTSTVHTSFSGLQDSDTSAVNEISPMLPRVEPITTTSTYIELFPAHKRPEKSDCTFDDNSNAENDINVINCEPSTSAFCKKATPRKKRKRSLSRTPQKQTRNPVNPAFSPDLFSDDEPACVLQEAPPVREERFILKSDRQLLKRVYNSLGGVLPPPSLTTVDFTVGEMLEKIESNGLFFWDGTNGNQHGTSLLLSTKFESCTRKEFPAILEDRYHGLHHNRSKISEELETVCAKYSQRYVGAETQSSCTIFDNRMGSPSKRKSNRLRWVVKSPGRRLSHLAQRRITFSSANLLAGGQSQNFRQVAVDARRYELLTRRPSPRKNRSPRKTPRKSPRKSIRTPTSSAKKRLVFRTKSSTDDEALPGPSTSTLRASATKRALFQSPEKKLLAKSSKIVPSTSNSSLSPWKKRGPPKRALFCSPSKSSPSNKRKRLDSDDYLPSKIPRSLSMQEEGSGNVSAATRLKSARSESNLVSHSMELSAHHKKKLHWAVYEAMRGQNIGVSHPQFKQFASTLARVTRRLLPSLMATPKSEMGTSERMLRIAKQHVFAVTKGKTVDEIIQGYEASRLRPVRPVGYISKEAAGRMDVSVARGKDSAFQDKANTIMNNSIKETKPASRPESKIERVKKIINFDDDNSRYSFR